MSTKISQEIVDQLAKLEVDSLLDGLNDDELRKNPAFLAKVRQFLKDNNFVTTTAVEGVESVVRTGSTIPNLLTEYDSIDMSRIN